MGSRFARVTAEQAAALIHNGQTVGFSGFTPAGSPKVVPVAIGQRARAEHDAGRPFRIGVITGASTGHSLDGSLAEADAILFRTPYQSDVSMRKLINAGSAPFFDMHLSMLPQAVRYGFLGPVHMAVIEACDVNDGEIVLTSAVGAAPTLCRVAEKIVVELNRKHPPELRGIHDIYEPADPPHRREIPIFRVSDRIGTQAVRVDPSKIVGVVETDLPDEVAPFEEPNDVTKRIGDHVAEFLAQERVAGRIPATFLPIQSGVGNIANAVLSALGSHAEIPPFEMFTEVIQDAVIGLLRQGRIRFASGCSLTVSPAVVSEIYENLAFFKEHILLRPQEITNHPELVRRLGLISLNTAIEADLCGNVNSTHVMGRSMMNGVGGSGDFARNAFLSIFSCPSEAKGGKISTIVPMVSHLDHSEHSVQVLVTEQGVADLRGKSPLQRARLVVERCASPRFRPILNEYVDRLSHGHTPHHLVAATAMHRQFMETGDMATVEWGRNFGG